MTTDSRHRTGITHRFTATLRRQTSVADGRDVACSTIYAQHAVVTSEQRPEPPTLRWRSSDRGLVMRWTLATARELDVARLTPAR